MKTNISIDLDEAQLRALASFLAGKPVIRTATRAAIKETATALLLAAIDQWRPDLEADIGPVVAKVYRPISEPYSAEIAAGCARHGYAPGSDRAHSYARGWAVSARKT